METTKIKQIFLQVKTFKHLWQKSQKYFVTLNSNDTIWLATLFQKEVSMKYEIKI